tara:strand:+ start:557 stop:817 length:261 start_codon:yes stop_codon:yes gene_type:complete
MKCIGKGKLEAALVSSFLYVDQPLDNILPQKTIDSLNKGWDEEKPAKLAISRGRAPLLIDGSHRSAYFVLIGKPDYMVPVEFYTDD